MNAALTPPKHTPLQPAWIIKPAVLPKGVCTGWCLNQTELFPSSSEVLPQKLISISSLRVFFDFTVQQTKSLQVL